MDKKTIKKAWKQYFDEVKHNLDSEGWYNGSNDLVQKTFPNIEVRKARHHQRPLELNTVKKVDVEQESIAESKRHTKKVKTNTLK